jgi:hypothetical protein
MTIVLAAAVLLKWKSPVVPLWLAVVAALPKDHLQYLEPELVPVL